MNLPAVLLLSRRRHPTRAAVLSVAVATVSALAIIHPAWAATLERGPYLQVSTPNSITIRWRTDTATNSRVRYGPSPTSLTYLADNATSSTGHTVVLTGLGPETQYYYSIGSTTQVLAGGSSDYTFKTAPPQGAARSTRVWVIGDSGEPGSDQRNVRDAFLNWTGSRSPDVWLMLGDNAYSTGTDTEYQTAVFDAYPQVLRKVPLWPTRGNHDEIHSGGDYYDIFTMPTAGQAGGIPSGTEAYYSFKHGNIHFISLDSEGTSRSSTGAMANWLRSDLSAAAADVGCRWIIAYWHHPPYSKGSHDSDSETQLREMRQNILPILEGTGVDLVLSGHSHAYERSYLLNGHYGTSGTLTSLMKLDAGTGNGSGGPYGKPAGIVPRQGAVYAVAGSSAKLSSGSLNHPAMVVSLYRLGSLAIDVDGNNLVGRFLDDAGTVRDNFTITKDTILAAEDPVPGEPPSAAPSFDFALRIEPNPFQGGGAKLAYVVPSPGRADLSIYGVDGRRVARLLDREVVAGSHTQSWNGRDGSGAALPAGVYYAVLTYGGQTRVQRLVKLQ